MTTSSGARVRRARRELAEVADELRALQALDEAALRARFEATFQLSAKGRSTARLARVAGGTAEQVALGIPSCSDGGAETSGPLSRARAPRKGR